jgi:hypothetical protein
MSKNLTSHQLYSFLRSLFHSNFLNGVVYWNNLWNPNSVANRSISVTLNRLDKSSKDLLKLIIRLPQFGFHVNGCFLTFPQNWETFIPQIVAEFFRRQTAQLSGDIAEGSLHAVCESGGPIAEASSPAVCRGGAVACSAVSLDHSLNDPNDEINTLTARMSRFSLKSRRNVSINVPVPQPQSTTQRDMHLCPHAQNCELLNTCGGCPHIHVDSDRQPVYLPSNLPHIMICRYLNYCNNPDCEFPHPMNESCIVSRKDTKKSPVYWAAVCVDKKCSNENCPNGHFSKKDRKLARERVIKFKNKTSAKDSACSAVACSAVACSAVACSAVACSAVACSADDCSTVDCEVETIIVDASNVGVSRSNIGALHRICCEGLQSKSRSTSPSCFVFGSYEQSSQSKDISVLWKNFGYNARFTVRKPGQGEEVIDALVASQVMREVLRSNKNHFIVVATGDGAVNGQNLSIHDAIQLGLERGCRFRLVCYKNVSKRYLDMRMRYPSQLEIKIITSHEVNRVAEVMKKQMQPSASCAVEGQSLAEQPSASRAVAEQPSASRAVAEPPSASCAVAGGGAQPIVVAINESDFLECGNKRGRINKGWPVRGWVKALRTALPEFAFSKVSSPMKTAKQLQQERLARLKASNPRLYKALMKKD